MAKRCYRWPVDAPGARRGHRVGGGRDRAGGGRPRRDRSDDPHDDDHRNDDHRDDAGHDHRRANAPGRLCADRRGALLRRPDRSLAARRRLALPRRPDRRRGHRGFPGPELLDDGWTPVAVPNSFNAGDFSAASQAGSVGWYRRDFTLPATAFPAYVPARFQSWIIRFESVNYQATVWLNGHEIGTHSGAYLPWELKLTGPAGRGQRARRPRQLGPGPQRAAARARRQLVELRRDPARGVPARGLRGRHDPGRRPADPPVPDLRGDDPGPRSLIAQSLREVLALHAQAMGDPSRPMAHLVDPSYGEYRRAVASNEFRAKVWGEHVLGWAQDVFPEGAAGIFWTGHPNNPTGRAWDRDALAERVDAAVGMLTIVDEGSLPFLPDEADRSIVASAATRDNLLVLRSLTKPCGMPGLRVGYAVASPDMVTRLRQYQDPWTVTASAEAAAHRRARRFAEYRERTLDLVPRRVGPDARIGSGRSPASAPTWPDRVRPADVPSDAELPPRQPDADGLGLGRAPRRPGPAGGSSSASAPTSPASKSDSLLTGPDQLVATRGHIRVGVRTPEENDRLLAALSDLLASDPAS